MRTIRRDKLMRLAMAGKLVAVGSYHYEDSTGSERMKDGRFPVRIQTPEERCREGWYNLMEHDFKSNSGCATVSDDGKTVSLYVHSNCNYELQMADGSAFVDGPEKASKAQRPENTRMQAWLAEHGIDATPKYLFDGSLKGCWRLYGKAQKWTLELAAKLNDLGFVDFDGQPLGPYSGNGGHFMTFVRGHNELLNG